MANDYFTFKQFTINQDKSAFKVGTDGVLLGACADIAGVKSILDIGSGTGLIAIMLAQRCDALITAIEPDKNSFIQAKGNVNLCKWRNRIRVIRSDLQNFSPGNEKFDLIVTNPPYFCNSLKNPDPRKSSARHNDSLTSDEILKGISRLMEDDGRLQIILPYVEGNVFIAEAQKSGLYCNSILKIKPLPAAEIRRLVLTFSMKRLTVTERFLTIEHGKRHEFTEEYINLTRDFYLKF
ncbi:MAG: methyltransferase domain-containing protein [Bacteroidetes bacterium]|nr:MAG: methyltransferase domain-containing protein [Bacteroidota bacterium]